MAAYFLRSKHLSRGKGARATRAAAYRAGERIRDARTSEVYDYSDRDDVAYKEVVLPADLVDRPDMAWARDRSILWNAAEHAGLRRNSRVAREWLVLLPPELSAGQRTRLVGTFARELADRYRCAVDVSIHQPRPGADRRNHHAHLLMTTREVTPDGLGPRTVLELGGRERYLLGLAGSSRDEYVSIRERWAQMTNQVLREAGLAARIDHRSLKDQGIDREPTPTIPEKVFYAERRSGKHSAAGDAIRARHRERVEARLKGGDELARVRQKQDAQLKERALEGSRHEEARPKQIRWSQLTRNERNEMRRERYRARRALEKLDVAGEAKRRGVQREAARARYRARMQQDPEAVREARRQWRKTYVAQINRKQREYRQQHAGELAAKRREYRRLHAEEERLKQRERRQRNAERNLSKDAPTTAEESAQRWKAYRESHGLGATAEESARNWLTFRESQKLPRTSQSVTPRAPAEGLTRASADIDDDRQPGKQRDDDFTL